MDDGRVNRAVYTNAPVLLIAVNENIGATQTLLSLGADPNVTGSFRYERHPDAVDDWRDYENLSPTEWQLLVETQRWTPLMEAVLTGERRFDKQYLLPYLTD